MTCPNCAALEIRRDELLAVIVKLTQTTPLPEELIGWEAQRAALIAEVGTLRAALTEAIRDRDLAEQRLTTEWLHAVKPG